MFKLPALVLVVSASVLAATIVQTERASANAAFQGKATTGEEIYLETDSINSASRSNVQFSYKIGIPGKRFDSVKAAANCYNGLISPQKPGDFPVFQPNTTGATRKMYNQVCGISNVTSRVRPLIVDQAQRDEPTSESEYVAKSNRFIRMANLENDELTLYILRNEPERFVRVSRLMCQLRGKGLSVRDSMAVLLPSSPSPDVVTLTTAVAGMHTYLCPQFRN